MNSRESRANEWPLLISRAAGRIALLIVAIALIGYLWLAVALGGGSPEWIERITLMAAVAFGAYWLLGWWPSIYTRYRRLLLGITVLLMLPALILLFAVEPWQRVQTQKHAALWFNQDQLQRAVERLACPNGDVLVVTPWIFIVDGETSRRLVELRLIPAAREKPSRMLARTTAGGDVAGDEMLATHWEAAASCAGSTSELEALIRRMADGGFE